MQSRAGQRTVAILLAVFAQGTLIGLCILPRTTEVANGPETPSLLFIQRVELQPVAPPSRRNRSVVDSSVARVPAAVDRGTALDPIPPQTTVTAPQPVPPRDWYQSMEKAARETVRRKAEQDEHGNPLDSKPKVLELPKAAQKGTEVQRLGNGEVITRDHAADDKETVCVYRPLLLSEYFDRGAHPRAPICRTYSTRSGLEGIDNLKPGYLRRPVPKPVPAGGSARDAATDDLP